MTILHVIQQLSLGGGTRTLVATSRHSTRLGGFQHKVVSLLPGPAEALELCRAGGVTVVNAPDTPTLMREMAAADVVQIEWWNSPEMQALLHRELPPLRMLVWYHVCGDGPPQVIPPALVAMADLNVATNPWTASELPVFRDLFAEDRVERVAWVIPGAEFDRLQGIKPRAHTGFNIGYIGTVDFVKMHRRFVPMSAAVRTPGTRFVVCGAGSALDVVRAEARELHAAERFDFRGFVGDIKPVIEELDVYGYPLCPDTYASGELNLQEIMFAGVPPVVFPHGGIRGLIEHGKTGLVVSSEAEYRDALEHLCHHPEERKRLGEAARAHARQHFGALNAARAINPLYQRLLRLPKRAPVWGCRPGQPLWQAPLSPLELSPLPAPDQGTRLFVECLGAATGAFLDSLTLTEPAAALTADEAVSQSSALVRSAFSGGILNYRLAFPEEGWLSYWTGLVLAQENQPAKALGEFARALRQGCAHWRVHWHLARAAAQLGDRTSAARAARLVLKEQPGLAPAQQLLATLEAGTSVVASTTAAEVAAQVSLARAAVAAGRIEDFEAALARALELEPDNPDACLLLADLNLQCQRFPDAAKSCMKVLTRHPHHVPALLLLAASFVGIGEHDAARATYQHVLSVDPGNPTACAHLQGTAVSPAEEPQACPPAPPLVSAIVSAYKSERFMRGCLEDLTSQTLFAQGLLEIVVVDSASPENEKAIVEEYRQRFPNIIYVRSDQRETVYGAWNRGIKASRGKYLTNANTDDRHRRDALEVLAQTLDRMPEVALVYADVLVTQAENATFADPHATNHFKWLDFDRRALLEKGCFVGPQPMWRREVHETHGWFDDTLQVAGDYEFWLRLASQHQFLHVKETLGLYLESPASVEHANRDRVVQESAAARARHRAAILGQMPPAPAPAAPSPTVAATKPAELPDCGRVGRLDEARRAFGEKKLQAAWELTLAALQCRPFHPEAHLLLAEIAGAAGDSVTARRCAQSALDMAPGLKAAKRFLRGNLRGNAKPEWLKLPEALLDPPKRRQPALSVCLIVRNEEQFLGRCLDSVRGLANQIVVVDTGSTDRTVEIAREHGAQLHNFTWCDDFSAARNLALEHANGDWVLALDADEELPPDQHDALRKHLLAGAVISWRLPIRDAGREEEGQSYVPRLFRNAPGLYYTGRIHEQVFRSVEDVRRDWGLDTRLGEACLLHHGYSKALTLDRDKVARNLRLLEMALAESPSDANLLMSHGLELTRAGRREEGLAAYRAAFDLLSRVPATQVVPELREMLLAQFSTHLTAAQRRAEVVALLTSPLAKAGAGLTSSLHFTLGLAQMELGEFGAASEQFRQCLAKRGRPVLAPINPEIHRSGPRHCLALSLERSGDAAGAEREFEAAHQAFPDAAGVVADWGRFLHGQGRPVDALQVLHRFVQQNPSAVAVWVRGGLIALSQAAFLEVALDWTAEALRLHPEDRQLQAQRAEALLLAGKVESALPLWRQLGAGGDGPAAGAVVVCETALGDHQFQPKPQDVAAITAQFVNWYRRLIEFGATTTVQRVNAGVDGLGQVLPKAAELLRAVIADVGTQTSGN